jgi:hypothetical protein
MPGKIVVRSWWLLVVAAVAAMAGHRYEIEATADPARDKLAGTVRLTYRNHTPNRLTEAPLRGMAGVTRIVDGNRRELSRTGSGVTLGAPREPGQETLLVLEFERSLTAGANGYRLLAGA